MSATDRSLGGVGEPAIGGEAVSTSDVNFLTTATRGLWVGGAGNVKVLMLGGDIVTFQGVAAGTLLPIRVTRVYSTDTTATLMVGLY
jgi:hypothetical protein